jgi:hypothetical protein
MYPNGQSYVHAERQREYRETHKNLSAEYMRFQR